MLIDPAISFIQNNNYKNMVLMLVTMVIVYIVFWLLNYFTPEYNDDLVYKFFFVNGMRYIPIKNFQDILYSQYHHFFLNNGRTLVHTIAQTFTGLWGKEIFNFINAAVFIALILILTKFMGKVSPGNYLFVTATVLLLFPSVNMTILWMTGSINYMWVCLTIALVLLYVPKLERWKLKKIYLCLIIPGIFAGWGHEGICLPLAMSFIIYLYVKRKTIYKTRAFPLILGFITGAIMCSLSPGIINRAGIGEHFNVNEKLLNIINIFSHLKIIYFLIGYVIMNFITSPNNFRRWIEEFYKKYSLLIWAIVFSLLIFFISNTDIPRVGFGMEFFAFIILLEIIKNHTNRKFKVFQSLIILFFIIFYIQLYNVSLDNYRNYRELIANLQKHESSIIIYNRSDIPQYLINHVVHPLLQNCLSRESPTNKRLSILYGYDSLMFIPKRAYQAILNDIIDPDFNNREKYNMDVTKISESDINKKPFRVYVKKPANEMLRKEDNLIYEAITRPKDFQIIYINDQWWLLSVRKKYDGCYPVDIVMK